MWESLGYGGFGHVGCSMAQQADARKQLRILVHRQCQKELGQGTSSPSLMWMSTIHRRGSATWPPELPCPDPARHLGTFAPRDSKNPFIKEYTLNYSRNPTMIEGILLNSGVLESLGTLRHVPRALLRVLAAVLQRTWAWKCTRRTAGGWIPGNTSVVQWGCRLT